MCCQMPKGWVIVTAQKVIRKLTLKVYSLVCLIYHLVYFRFWSQKCGTATNGSPSSDLLSLWLMVVLCYRKPAKFAMHWDHQKHDSLIIFDGHTSKKFHFLNSCCIYRYNFSLQELWRPDGYRKNWEIDNFYEIGHLICCAPLKNLEEVENY